MFEDCDALITAPGLPSTELPENCYEEMFSDCDGLKAVPQIPAATAADGSCKGMFSGCDNIVLSKTENDREWEPEILAPGISTDMFKDCPYVDLDGEGGKTPVPGVTYYTGLLPRPYLSGITSTSVTYGETLSVATVTGTARYDGKTVNGTWSFASPSVMPEVSDSKVTEYGIIFTPEGTACGTSAGKVKLTVNRKAVTVKACDSVKYSGEEDPGFTASVTGTLGGDTVLYRIVREAGEEAGTYDIIPAGEEDQGNYRISYRNGTLTIKPVYSFTFEMKKHGEQVPPQTVKEGKTAERPEDPEESGWNFVGWYREEECETEWNFETDRVTEDTAVYAKWISKEEEEAEWTAVPDMPGRNKPLSGGKWVYDDRRWRYLLENSFLRHALAGIEYTGSDGKTHTGWFLFDKQGRMQTGWQLVGESWYYFSEETGSEEGMMQTGWHRDPSDGKTYYLEADGRMAAGWKKIGGVWYYFTEEKYTVCRSWTKDPESGKWKYTKETEHPFGSLWTAGETPDGSNGKEER